MGQKLSSLARSRPPMMCILITQPPNTGLERTAHSADEIVAIWALVSALMPSRSRGAPPLKPNPFGGIIYHSGRVYGVCSHF
jgi:hypothetical protein